MPPISLDSGLAIHPGSKGEEAHDVSEYGRAGRLGRPSGLPKRWSAQRKAEVVLRLLRGEDIGEVSREIRVAPPELERWRREFLERRPAGLEEEEPACLRDVAEFLGEL